MNVDPTRISNPESRIASELQWYAIWTRSRHEQVVREQLERKRFEAFLPTITRWSRWKDRKKKIDWPPKISFTNGGPRGIAYLMNRWRMGQKVEKVVPVPPKT